MGTCRQCLDLKSYSHLLPTHFLSMSYSPHLERISERLVLVPSCFDTRCHKHDASVFAKN